MERDHLEERDRRLARHVRQGFSLAMTDPAYRRRVLERLEPQLAEPPSDVWSATPWLWAAVLGEEVTAGSHAEAVRRAAGSFRAWLEGDDTRDLTSLSVAGVDVPSAVRSHPFADLRAWSIRKTFRAS